MEGDRLILLAERLAGILGEHCALVGGMAVSAWGHVRATPDIDFAARTADAEEIVEMLAAHGLEVETFLRTEQRV